MSSLKAAVHVGSSPRRSAPHLSVVSKRKVLPPSTEAHHSTMLHDELLELAHILHQNTVQPDLSVPEKQRFKHRGHQQGVALRG